MKLKILDDAAVISQFTRLKKHIRDQALKPLVQQIGRMVASAAMGMVPKQTGLLARSIGVSSVKLYKATGSNAVDPSQNVTGRLETSGPADVVYVAVGPRRGFGRQVARNAKGKLKILGKKASGGVLRDPVKYGHLVEGGHQIVTGGFAPGTRRFSYLHTTPGGNVRRLRAAGRPSGQVGGFVPPRPFMAPAAAAVEPAAQAMAEALVGAAVANINFSR